MAKDTRVRRRERKNIASGVAHVASTFNNTMITITDAQGNTIVLVTHDASVAANANRAIRLRDGRIESDTLTT